MKLLFAALLLWTGQVVAQSITIPAQTIVTPVTINGTTVQISITVPSQTVALPPSGGSALPAGLTWSGSVLTVAGSVSATSVSLTGGAAVPACASNLYLWQMTSGVLQPACYVPTIVPPITVASTAPNTITLTP